MTIKEFLSNNTTLIIAIYGALLSTIGIVWNIYKGNQDKAKIKVDAYIGVMTSSRGAEGPFLFIKAVNYGRRAVTLSSVGIRVSTDENIVMMNINLPCELHEGKSHNEWIELEKLRKASCEFAWYKDETGKMYKSKSIKKMLNNYFNPRKNRKSKPINIRPLD